MSRHDVSLLPKSESCTTWPKILAVAPARWRGILHRVIDDRVSFTHCSGSQKWVTCAVKVAPVVAGCGTPTSRRPFAVKDHPLSSTRIVHPLTCAAGRALAATSMATPHVWLPREVDDDMAASGALMVKHRWGAGGQGNRPLTPGNLGELGEREIVTERVEDDEHAVFLTYDRGEVALEGAFQKVLYFAGEGRRNLTVDRPELRELARAAVAALTPEPHGTYHVDIMGDRVLEINAGRAFGGTPDPYLCWAAGISMPETLLKIATGEKWEYRRVPGGIRMTHFNNYLFEHAGREWLFRG